jgi:myosin-1
MWADGEGAITDVHKNPLTAGTIFKQSMQALTEVLTSKVLFFALGGGLFILFFI